MNSHRNVMEDLLDMYTDRLPFSGITQQSRHSSYLGARSAAARAGSQTARYLELLRTHPDGLTDAQAATLLRLERTSINARRAPLVKAGQVYAAGFRKSACGIKNVVWKRR